MSFFSCCFTSFCLSLLLLFLNSLVRKSRRESYQKSQKRGKQFLLLVNYTEENVFFFSLFSLNLIIIFSFSLSCFLGCFKRSVFFCCCCLPLFLVDLSLSSCWDAKHMISEERVRDKRKGESSLVSCCLLIAY